eukprot:619461-Rhodomonas_salina.1
MSGPPTHTKFSQILAEFVTPRSESFEIVCVGEERRTVARRLLCELLSTLGTHCRERVPLGSLQYYVRDQRE